jgi:saccharopine dehydrogenase-like NADP-dependent oxidoreductase
MKKILIIGAGRSATTLIHYLLDHSIEMEAEIIVCDQDLALANSKIGNHPRGLAVAVNIMNSEDRLNLLRDKDLVLSMMPPALHLEIAKDCIKLRKPLMNASYVSKEMQSLHEEVKSLGLLFCCELGLDPGIDHMSAMQIIDDIHGKGGTIKHFYSYTGGLVAPESDNNPWHYKFSWSPRNVVVAGQGTAQYLENDQIRFVPYQRIFSQIRSIEVPYGGTFEVYANRDSLSYIDKYNLQNASTVFRGTIRKSGFCEAWNALLKIGLTDSHFNLPEGHGATFRCLTSSLIPPYKGDLESAVAHLCNTDLDSPLMDRLKWLGIFSEDLLPLPLGSPADNLEQLLLEKWKLQSNDRDLIVMQHEFHYEINGKEFLLKSALQEIGVDSVHTAMSRLVGLPLAIFAKHYLMNGSSFTGVHIPIHKEMYEPILHELSIMGVTFKEYKYEK